jgi:outer membrane protein OmpA-like peptidoglycan-associated protein
VTPLRCRWLLLAMLVLLPCAQAAELIRFVSCPVYRDTRAGRKSGCWLADDPATGLRYDVTPSPTKPDWNYAVLVEGAIADGTGDPCGGIVLEPVRVSRLLDRSCPRHMLPAEAYPGRPYSLPPRNVRPVFEERDVPPGPYQTTTFYLFFEFDQSFVSYQYGDYLLDRAITWIRAAEPKHIVITGYAATRPVTVSGEVLSEDADVARERAEVLHEALLRLGVPDQKIEVHWRTDPEPVDVEAADGLASASLRRVEIRAEL